MKNAQGNVLDEIKHMRNDIRKGKSKIVILVKENKNLKQRLRVKRK